MNPNLDHYVDPLPFTIHTTMATSHQTLEYLSLPAEVRNKIMGYVLMPGDVHPRVPLSVPAKKRAFDPKSILNAMLAAVREVSYGVVLKTLLAVMGGVLSGLVALFFEAESTRTIPPGFQLLATSKQVYYEGRQMFYGANVFHLPRGNLEDTVKWHEKLLPEHKAMIKRVQITMSVADLTPVAMEDFDIWRSADIHRRCSVHDCAATYLRSRVWKQKLDFLRAWKSLETVYIDSGWGAIPVHGRIFGQLADQYLGIVLDNARIEVRAQLRSMIGTMGWEATRDLLAGGARRGCV